MQSLKLPNSLRRYRKRACLSQQEVAFLLDCSTANHISRYELFSRIPTLHTALALALIFGSSAPALFSGEYQKVETVVLRQANRLVARLTTQRQNQSTERKLALLKSIV